MQLEQLARIGNGLAARYHTRDPFQIAEALGIEVLFRDDFTRLKGAYCVIKRQRFIFINSNLPQQVQRIVCAHEIGHDQLHRAAAKGNGIMEFQLYDMRTRPEYEANMVAAAMLLDTSEVLELIYRGSDAEQIACTLHSDINLVALKVDALIREGHPLIPQAHKSNFLH